MKFDMDLFMIFNARIFLAAICYYVELSAF